MKNIRKVLLLCISTFSFQFAHAADFSCSDIKDVGQAKEEIRQLRSQIKTTYIKQGALIGLGVTAEAAAIFLTGGASFVAQAGMVGAAGAAHGAIGAVVLFSGAALGSATGGVVAFFKAHNPASQRRELNTQLLSIEAELSSCL